MKGEFVTYEVAKRLKGLGFNSPCYAFYQEETIEGSPCMVDDEDEYRVTGFRTCVNSEIPDHYTGAPLRQQAFRWIREKWGYDISIGRIRKDKWKFEIDLRFVEGDDYHFIDFYFETYEEAEEACMEKLFWIIENKSEGAQGA